MLGSCTRNLQLFCSQFTLLSRALNATQIYCKSNLCLHNLPTLINVKKIYQNCLPKRESLKILSLPLFPLFVCDINNLLSAFLHIHLLPSKNTRISAFRKLLKWAMKRWVLFLHVSSWFIATQKQWTFCPSTHQIDAV